MGEMKKMLVRFTERTTMHGMASISSAKSQKALVFWSVVCLASMGMFIFMVSRLVIHYLSFPVVVRVEQVSNNYTKISLKHLLLILETHNRECIGFGRYFL